MSIVQEEHGSIIVEVVSLRRATLAQADAFKKILFQDIETGWRKIIIDLVDCEFIDSSFLGAMVISLKKIQALGGSLRLVGIQPEVRNMLQLTRVVGIFDIYETKEDALESFM
jgi:anti-anti-sigma factor